LRRNGSLRSSIVIRAAEPGPGGGDPPSQSRARPEVQGRVRRRLRRGPLQSQQTRCRDRANSPLLSPQNAMSQRFRHAPIPSRVHRYLQVPIARTGRDLPFLPAVSSWRGFRAPVLRQIVPSCWGRRPKPFIIADLPEQARDSLNLTPLATFADYRIGG
jgi:hypothetical protein